MIRRPWRSRPRLLYAAIALGPPMRVKFGRSYEPERRVSEIQREVGGVVFLAGCVSESWCREFVVIDLLMPYRIRGEWFHAADPVLSFVGSLIRSGMYG